MFGENLSKALASGDVSLYDSPDASLTKNKHHFVDACEDNRPYIVREYLQAGMSPDETSSLGTPVLALAFSHHGDCETVRLLLDAGANPNTCLNQQRQRGNGECFIEYIPLLYVALWRRCDQDFVRYLVGKGATYFPTHIEELLEQRYDADDEYVASLAKHLMFRGAREKEKEEVSELMCMEVD